ncbi:hypothetical protein CUMW_156160 [Citrus unshiu]|uniref:ATP-dependent Clp protease proteolytic subunit n=1 Tax=Citrus unshiu TaxID=55188 RepID=A0A2H5PPS2_CITUN|nr:hypothetical protein CUMW_156160 [Citrus unshiu]GAY54366.1 hypothetical protein CUMW_156160 [Citrus unshiu]
MAQSCAAALSSTAIFAAFCNHFPAESHSSSLRFSPLRLRKMIVSSNRERKCEKFGVKAAYTSDYSSLDDCESTWKGIWSIRNDLEVPSSPYIPTYAQGEQGGGPPPMLLGRFQNVLSQLFQHRIIRCGGPVEDDMANIIVAQLLYLDAVDPNKDIIMYLNSPGGSVTAGTYDRMFPLYVLDWQPGKRYSLPNSRIMIHQPLGGAQGGQSDIDLQANEMLHHKANLNGYLSYHTGQTLEKINEDTDRDFFMSAEEAKDYGLIDGVVMNPHKILQPVAAAAGQ